MSRRRNAIIVGATIAALVFILAAVVACIATGGLISPLGK